MGRALRVREEPEAGPGYGSTLQPPRPQHRPHDVLRPGENKQQQPTVQEGQGITLH